MIERSFPRPLPEREPAPGDSEASLGERVRRERAEQAALEPEEREARRGAYREELKAGRKPKLTPEEQRAHEERERRERTLRESEREQA